MIKPTCLKEGEKVALVSLSSGLAGEELFLHRYETGKRRLEEIFGLKVVPMPNALKGIAYLDEHPEARAMDLMQAFEDTSVKGIICMIGGDDTIRLLPYIDYEVIKRNPKVFMGYSDSTANHFMMYKAGLTSFHGPSAMVEFAENVSMHDYTIDSIRNTLFEPKETLKIISSPVWTSEFLEWTNQENNDIQRTMVKEEHGYEVLQGSGKARGRLIGGCLSILQMITGTSIWPKTEEWKGKILFLETAEDYPTPENVLYFLRNLTAQGIIGQINGIIVGKPLDEKYYEEYKEVYKKVVGKEANRPDLPIIYNVNCSHTAPVNVIPYGIEAEIDCEQKKITFLEKAVSES